MNKLKLLLVCFALFACLFSQAQVDKKNWKLVWVEDFNGTKLDTTRWNYVINGDGGGNNELQYYTARDTNAYVKGGLLHIGA